MNTLSLNYILLAIYFFCSSLFFFYYILDVKTPFFDDSAVLFPYKLWNCTPVKFKYELYDIIFEYV